MTLKRFDRKFGADLLRELPAEPAVYLFKDEEGQVIYAGKAKDIRRRLQGYRNASRRKAHRKMRTLVRESSTLEVRLQPSEQDALLVENELIRTLRPRYNVEGAYTFLYPAIGTAVSAHQSFLVFTTRVDGYPTLAPRWHGVFRSRHRTRDAFDALVALLDLLGHREPRSRLPGLPLVRGSRVVAFRRIEGLMPGIERLLGGESQAVLKEIARRLLEKPDARQDAGQVGEDLRLLAAFYERDAHRLHSTLRAAGRKGCYVSQDERDALFIAHPPG
ncbi:MAG: GIY-YIG nuclease family protein [bacterium]|nr:GIY-YIG nuclease family protein [bacterium]